MFRHPLVAAASSVTHLEIMIMITIDGAMGEGGGQVLRSALTLSVLTGQPFEIKNIRAGRAKPGLLRQHLTALRAAATVCGGRYTDGIGVGACELLFYPGDIRAGHYEFAVGTAGSAMLVLQTILLPLIMADAPSRVLISGGTHNPAAPPFEFINACFLPVLRAMGADIKLKLLSYGFIPAGGGRVMAEIEPGATLKSIELHTRGEQQAVIAEAYFANLPFDVAARELATLGARLALPEADRKVREVKSVGPGNMLAVTLRYEHITEMVTGFGRRGLPAEDIAETVAVESTAYLAAEDIAVGRHLADQLLLPMALAGSGTFTTLTPTLHTRTNAEIIKMFLDIDIRFEAIDAFDNMMVRVERKAKSANS